MAEEIIVRKIEIEVDGAVKSLEMVEKATDDVAESQTELKKGLDALPGPLGKAQQGLKALNKGFKALLANPVILVIAGIVAGLAALAKAFTKTQSGADKLKNVMSSLSAAMEVITERAAKLFKALGSILKGDFKEGFEAVGESVKGVGEEIREATAAAVEYEKAVRALYEGETELLTINAERRKQIEELVFKTRDLTLSHEERRQAIVDAAAIEEEILADNIKLQEQRIALAKAELENTPEQLRTREQERKLQEETAALIDLQTASGAKQRELKNRLNEIDAKAAADSKASAQELARLEKERADQMQKIADGLDKFNKGLAADEEDIDDMLAADQDEMDEYYAERARQRNEETNEAAIANAEKRYDKEDELAAQQAKTEELLLNTKKQIYADGVSALVGFLGEGSRAGKAVQIADATRSAIAGAINAFKSAAGLPAPVGPILAPIAAGAALAAGMANVKKMATVKAPGEKGSVSAPNVSISRPSSLISSSDINQPQLRAPRDVNIIQDSSQRGTIKSYVVSSEVTAKQEIDEQRAAEADL
jgi:DNA repair exonuclease SbcCD ATPase subunit